jgi:hypothetical protein
MPRPAVECCCLLLWTNTKSGHLGSFDIICCGEFYVTDTGLSTRKQNTGEIILQILSSWTLME